MLKKLKCRRRVMASLRRRIGRAAEEAPVFKDKIVVEKSAEKGLARKGRKRFQWLIFALGGIAGLVAAGLLARSRDGLWLDILADLRLDSLVDVLPAGIIRDVRELTVSIESLLKW